MQTEVDKKLKRLFLQFPEETISRFEVSKKRSYGNNQEIEDLFRYASSEDNDGEHCYGTLKREKKMPCKINQPVFHKKVPESDEEHIELLNNLSRIGMTMDEFLPPRVHKQRAGAGGSGR